MELFPLTFIPLEQEANTHYSIEDLITIHAALNNSIIDSTQYFPTQSNCGGCHGFDIEEFALVDAEGNDVNIYDDWRPTMMANAAKDPFWRAKVSHEGLINPDHKNVLEDKCTSCHAPMGHYTSKYHLEPYYTMDSLLIDTIGLDGVSCGTCHQISAENLGNQHSGNINFDTTRVAYGPYDMPFAAPMTSFVGFTPVQSDHIHDAGICASCHTLITNSVDLDGELTGTTFTEQATYHEWLNSVYNDDVTCQGCHLPQIQDSVIISDNYLFLEGKSPFGLHELVGANTMMLQLMRDNKESLGINAEDYMYNETIEKTFEMLQEKSIDMNLEMYMLDFDSAYFKVQLSNKAGHKFPSGYPSRRASIQFVVTTEEGDTLFKSGLMTDSFETEGEDAQFEPHYQMINQSSQAQIYELVGGDVNGNFTTILERAFEALKDNRLAPVGFTTAHEVYDTTQIVGNALADPDFNKDENGTEGSGSDIVYYHVPLNEYNGLIHISVKIFYQSLPPKWMAEIFEDSTPEIETFRAMFDEADQSPVLIASANLDSVFVQSTALADEFDVKFEINIAPNPNLTGVLLLHHDKNVEVQKVKIYSQSGSLLQILDHSLSEIKLPFEKGFYLLEIQTNKGIVVEKVLRL